MRRDFPLELPEDGSEAEATVGISVCDVTAGEIYGRYYRPETVVKRITLQESE